MSSNVGAWVDRSLADRIAEVSWYHTIELPGGVVTPGQFDHRSVLDRYELPEDLTGMRVLDVGTFDGFFAFEFERRGAEVVGIDLPDKNALDWPAPLRRRAYDRFDAHSRGFEIARDAFDSSVTHRKVSVYDVHPDDLGVFDLVFMGSVLAHLRDPVGALMALHRVCGGRLHVAAAVDARLDLVSRWIPLARFTGLSPHLTWWLPNRRALAEMTEAAGYRQVGVGQRFDVPRPNTDPVPHAIVRAQPGPPS